MRSKRALLPALLLLALFAAACGGTQPTPSLALPSPSPGPTAASPLLVLVAPPQADAALTAAAAELASAYAANHQLRFEQRQLLDPSQLPAGLAKLILLAPDPGVAGLSSVAPNVPIVTVGFSPEGQLANVIAIGLGDLQPEAAFIAGYAAALSADDWRAGMLYTAASAHLADDFIAGAEYFCGACNPLAPPTADYPQAVQAGDPANWQAAADQLLANQIHVVYLSPELETSGAGQYLASFGIQLIGSGTPPADLAVNWLTSISADPVAALATQLEPALDGAPAAQDSSLVLTNTIISTARLAFIQRVIDDLMAGYILLPSD
ncbi:MAG: hypothetical protein WD751_11270 [Anaerolineales bacterium]